MHTRSRARTHTHTHTLTRRTRTQAQTQTGRKADRQTHYARTDMIGCRKGGEKTASKRTKTQTNPKYITPTPTAPLPLPPLCVRVFQRREHGTVYTPVVSLHNLCCSFISLTNTAWREEEGGGEKVEREVEGRGRGGSVIEIEGCRKV